MIISCGEALTDFFKNEKTADFTPMIGGSLLNVAVAIAKSGNQAALMTNISNDQFGQAIFDFLQDNKVSTDYISRSAHMSGLIFVHYNSNKSAFYSYYGDATAEKNFVYARDKMPISKQVNCLHFGSFSLVIGRTAQSFAALIEQEYSNRIISVDLNIRPSIEPNMKVWKNQFERLMPMMHIAKASSEDVMLMYGLSQISRIDCFSKMRHWHQLGAKMTVITDAENGAYILWRNEEIHLNANAVEIVDTVGAGDCFMANFLSRLDKLDMLDIDKFTNIDSKQIKEATQMAIAAATFTIAHKGATFPTEDDLKR